jgi:glycine/D-amino acid oxidase-like deaminating enzyme
MQAESLADDFPVRYRPVSDVETEYPWFSLDDYVGAVEYLDTGWIDPYSYATALAQQARSRGATVETNVTVTDILVTSDEGKPGPQRSETATVTGVDTDDGTYAADAVVVAAGWRTQELLPDGFQVPIRPYRTQAIVLRPDTRLPDAFPLGRLRDRHLYFRPEHNGDLLIGGAHALVDDPERASRDADESFTLDVADYVPTLVDGFDDAEFVNGWAGFDAATPDARPIIDSVGPDGLLVATGFNGLGVMISPVVGPTVRERVTGEAAPFPTEPFGLDRFESTATEFEYISTSDIS